MIAKFDFIPLQHVTIIPLACVGRVQRCLLGVSESRLYDVEYYHNGVRHRNEFYADELEAK